MSWSDSRRFLSLFTDFGVFPGNSCLFRDYASKIRIHGSSCPIEKHIIREQSSLQVFLGPDLPSFVELRKLCHGRFWRRGASEVNHELLSWARHSYIKQVDESVRKGPNNICSDPTHSLYLFNSVHFDTWMYSALFLIYCGMWSMKDSASSKTSISVS